MILTESYPQGFDLQMLSDMDYMIVHSADFNGPKSIHAEVPQRIGEILVRKKIVEDGLSLLLQRGLIMKKVTNRGFEYVATENSAPFVSILTTEYSVALKDRARWVIDNFGNKSSQEVSRFINKQIKHGNNLFSN